MNRPEGASGDPGFHTDELPPPPGCFVAVAGPSGAGKDTLISGVRERLAGDGRFVFARRVVSRQADGAEDHESVTEHEFEHLRATGAFLLSWSAHGLQYGIPQALMRDIGEGRVVIANVSRSVLPEMRRMFGRSFVVHVTAAPDVLAARLGARAREDAARQQARLARASVPEALIGADVTIDNSGNVEDSLLTFERALTGIVRRAPDGL